MLLKFIFPFFKLKFSLLHFKLCSDIVKFFLQRSFLFAGFYVKFLRVDATRLNSLHSYLS